MNCQFIQHLVNTADADGLRIGDCILLRMQLRILNQNPSRADAEFADSKFEDPHISGIIVGLSGNY